MRLIISLCLVVLFNLTYGQELKKIKNKISSEFLEVYFVLKSDREIKHGSYQLFKWNKIKTSGFYKNNKKDSLWLEYSVSGNLKSEGVYRDNMKVGEWNFYSNKVKRASGDFTLGRRTGVWNFFDSKGILAQQFNFENYELKQLNKAVVKLRRGIIGGKFDSLIYVDEPPFYGESKNGILKFIAKNLVYPEEAKTKGIMGKIYVSFIVNTEGVLTDFKVEKGIGGGCNDEALRVLKLSSGDWTPAIFENEKVNLKIVVPINLRLQ